MRGYLERVARVERAAARADDDQYPTPNSVMRSLPLPKDMPVSSELSVALVIAGVGADHGIGDSDEGDY